MPRFSRRDDPDEEFGCIGGVLERASWLLLLPLVLRGFLRYRRKPDDCEGTSEACDLCDSVLGLLRRSS